MASGLSVLVTVMDYIRADIRYYFGRLLPVPWQAVVSLTRVFPDLGIVLLGDDFLSEKAKRVIAHFVERHEFRAPIVITQALEGATELGVAMLPQIRVRVGGVEAARHHGLANYSVLSSIFTPLMY